MTYLLPVVQTPGLPRVAIGAWLPHASLVELDFAGLIERAAARLLEKGRRIVVMSPHLPKLAAARERLEALGLRPDRLLTVPAAPIGCERLTELLFERKNHPDAIFVMDDNLIPPLLAGLERAKVRAGRDVYVLAHCNWPRPLGLWDGRPGAPQSFAGPPGAPRSSAGLEHLGFDVREVLCAGKELIDAQHEGATSLKRVIPARYLGELTRPLQPAADVTVEAVPLSP
jgi:hypothetical protein